MNETVQGIRVKTDSPVLANDFSQGDTALCRARNLGRAWRRNLSTLRKIHVEGAFGPSFVVLDLVDPCFVPLFDAVVGDLGGLSLSPFAVMLYIIRPCESDDGALLLAIRPACHYARMLNDTC